MTGTWSHLQLARRAGMNGVLAGQTPRVSGSVTLLPQKSSSTNPLLCLTVYLTPHASFAKDCTLHPFCLSLLSNHLFFLFALTVFHSFLAYRSKQPHILEEGSKKPHAACKNLCHDITELARLPAIPHPAAACLLDTRPWYSVTQKPTW